MGKTSLLINSFNTGEVSELIESRSDVTKYASACKTLENAMPLVEGGAKKMPGTYFAGATANGGAMFTGSISGTTLTVTDVNYGVIQAGEPITGSGVASGTAVQLNEFTASISGNVLNVTAVASGSIAVGQTLSGKYVALGAVIIGLGTGTGGTGTYVLSVSQTVPSETMRTGATGGVGVYTVNVSQTVSSTMMQTGSSGKSRLVPFQFSKTQGAILELSAGLIRIWEPSSPGQWPLGLAVGAPDESNYDPATLYAAGNTVLLGPYAAVVPWQATPPGYLFIAAPYGTTNASTVPITFSVNSTDTLSVTVTWSSPNQGINIALANATPSHNAASAIEAAIQALVSLNSPSSNYVDLSAWTVTPDAVYYASPWITAPSVQPSSPAHRQGMSGIIWDTSQYIAICAGANQNDQFPLSVSFDSFGVVRFVWNTAYWEDGSILATQPIQIATPYAESDLFALDCSTQSADVLWIFHPNYPPAIVERLGSNSWQYSLSLPGQQSGEPAYRGTQDVVKTGYSALGQSISLISQSSTCTLVLASSSSSPPFSNGSRIYINECAGMADLNEGEFLVSGMANGAVSISVRDSAGTVTSISATGWHFSLQDPDTGATVNSSSFLQYAGGGFAVQVVPMFAASGDYPACGALYQERLFGGGTLNNPTRLYGSTQGDYPDFICDPNADDYAVQFTLVSSQVNQLLNMVGTPNGLAIGTSGGVWILSSSGGTSISQTNVNASPQTTDGVSNLQPQVVNGSAVFVSRSARIVTFLTYNFVTNQWENTDLTRLNRNITIGTSEETSGLAQTEFTTQPYPVYWAVRNDGQLIGLVFNTQDQVYAWFRVNMIPGGGLIESVAVITGQNLEDQIAVVVNRTINGVTQRYFEYFMPQELFGQLDNAFFVHCGQQFRGDGPFPITGITNANPCVVSAPGHTLQNGQSISIADVEGMTQANTTPLTAWTVAGVSGDTFQLQGIDSAGWGTYTSGGTVKRVTNELTGMSYLLGQNVIAVGDNQVIFQGSVTADTVVFPFYANRITIGIPYDTTIEPMNPILGSQQATSKGKKQKFSRVTISLYQSIGGKVGTDRKHLHAMSYGPSSKGNPPALFTGNITRDLDGDWTDEDTIVIVHSDPYPFTLRGVVPRLSVAEEG